MKNKSKTKLKTHNVGQLLCRMFKLPDHCREIRLTSRYGQKVVIQSDHLVKINGLIQYDYEKKCVKERTITSTVGYHGVKRVLRRLRNLSV